MATMLTVYDNQYQLIIDALFAYKVQLKEEGGKDSEIHEIEELLELLEED